MGRGEFALLLSPTHHQNKRGKRGFMGKGTGGKSKKGGQTLRHKGKYQKQVLRTAANKEKKRKKYLSANPNDQQNVEILTKLLKGVKGGGK